MLVTTQWVKDATVVNLSGRFDKSARAVLERALAESQETTTRHIVLDLANVSALDSAGIGKLFLTYHHLRRKGISLSLVNPRPNVRELLDLVHISLSIPIQNTLGGILSAA